MKTDGHRPDGSDESRAPPRSSYLLFKLDVARSYLDFAADTADPLPSLCRARAIVRSIARVLEQHELPVGRDEITRVLAQLHADIDAIERNYLLIADAAAARIAAAAALAQGDMIYFFVPSRQKLFAGDLSTIALRLRFAGRILAR